MSGTVFPAVHLAKAEKPTLSNPATGEDAVCFYRADQRATAVCAQCGVFVSEMYRVRIGDDDYCTNCVAKSRDDHNIPALVTRSTLRDYQAMNAAVFSLVLVIFIAPALFIAPWVIYLAIRYRKAPGGILPRSAWRMPVSAILAIIAFIGSAVWGYMLFIGDMI